MATLNPFKRLLNKLHSELDQNELQCLVNICGDYIPGGQREKISSGWNLFNILLRENKIGEEPSRMAYLFKIIKESRRGDLVSIVKKYIEENCPEQAEAILNDVESSFTCYPVRPVRPVIISRSSTPVPAAKCCDVHCGSCNCNCNPCCSCFCCCVIVATLLICLVVMAALLWYAKIFPNVDKHLSSDEDLKAAGAVIIDVLVFVAAFCFSCGIYIKRSLNNANDACERQRLVDDTGSYAPSDSTHTSRSAYARTASNSCESLSSARTS